MLLSVILLALFFAVALTQATQGMFSALLTAVLALCCAATAFGTYEWVAIHWIAPLWQPNYAHSIALGALFGVPLLVLRLVLDRLVRRRCLLPGWLDRVGGGVCGIVTALVMVGILAVCMQMLPFGGSIVGYRRVAMCPQPGDRRGDSKPPSLDTKDNGLLLPADRVAAALGSVLLDGIFSGSHRFPEHHPNLLEAVGWVGAARPEVSRYAPPKSVSLVMTEPVSCVYRLVPGGSETAPPTYEQEGPLGGQEFHAVRLKLKSAARDSRRSFTFTLRQIRLVGQARGDDAFTQYYPVAIQDLTDATRHIRYRKSRGQLWPVIDDLFVPAQDSTEIEMVFELPIGFKPSFVEYKRAARVPISFGGTAAASGRRPAPKPQERTAAAATPGPGPDRTATRRERAERGAVRGVATAGGGSRFSDEFPMRLTDYRSSNTEVAGGALVNGKLMAQVDRQANGRDEPISKFQVPDDKRLLQLNSIRLQARSEIGRALSRAVTTVQNYYVEDTNGERYTLVGKYAIASVRGRRYIEMQYFSGPVGSMGGLGKFTRIKEDQLQPDDEFVLLFLVNPGAHIKAFSTGGTATQREDLTDQNLVAPQ